MASIGSTVVFALSFLLTCRSSSGFSTPTPLVTEKIPEALEKPPAAIPSSKNQQELDSKKFPRTWVPIASAHELDPDRPSPIEFLGQRYVTYQDNSKNWVVMDDVCPHRLAPLSEGRIDRETDSVQCSYHGWAFNSAGSCTSIPQVSGKGLESALASKRSCVASYPTHVEKGVIFVWPWKEDVLSVAKYPDACPEGIMEGMGENVTTYTRDLPYGWDSLLENLIDPAHVPFAHHGMQGSRNDAIPINMTWPADKGESGFSFYFEDRTMSQMRAGEGKFVAPFMISYKAMFEPKNEGDEGKPWALSVLCIPTKPGWSRLVILSGKNAEEVAADKAKEKKPLIAKIFSALPVWLVHQLSNRFLDSDLAFLHFQEREIRRGTSYYMPAQADRPIQALRSWIPKYTDIEEPLPPAMPRSVLFDRWTQHTSQCKHCLAALQSMKKWRRVAYATLAASIFGFKFKLAKASTLLCLAALRVMHKLEGSFKKGEFKHYENH